jgi:hypothetical protein
MNFGVVVFGLVFLDVSTDQVCLVDKMVLVVPNVLHENLQNGLTFLLLSYTHSLLVYLVAGLEDHVFCEP